MGRMAQPRICQVKRYIYICRSSLYMCAGSQGGAVSDVVVNKTSRAGVLEAGRFDGYGLSKTGIDGDTQGAIRSGPVCRLVVSLSCRDRSRGEASLAQALAANCGRLGPVLHRAMQLLLQDRESRHQRDSERPSRCV